MKTSAYKIVIYDTSDYYSFPIGGQLTSIVNFLRYISEDRKDLADDILLVGITNEESKVGIIDKVLIGEDKFDFLPVLWRDVSLSQVKTSLRKEFLQALLKQGNHIVRNKKTIHYLHTPEAFIFAKLKFPRDKIVVFSHGSFLNMTSGFRFYQNNTLIKKMFDSFIIWLLKKSDKLFVLDDHTYDQYKNYNKNVYKVSNSIILPNLGEKQKAELSSKKLLFVGRLSHVKQVHVIIDAMRDMRQETTLTIVGDGEEREALETRVKNHLLEDRIQFTGSILPEEIGSVMRQHDILVMNSKAEGQPMTIAEAMGFGLPIISTAVGGIPEMMSDYQSGILTDGTEKAIIEAVDKISENYLFYSENAQRSARKYDYHSVNAYVLECLLA